MRLQKYIAECGIASRRAAEKMIECGRVSVNGDIVDFMGFIIYPDKDIVEIDGEEIRPEHKKYYIMLNKPKNYVTTVKVLIMTNDGEFANMVMHPSHEINKAYIAKVAHPLSNDQLNMLRRGVSIDGVITAPAKAENILNAKYGAEVKITIHEGKNRQVRKMLAEVGADVMSLKRISVGSLTLGNLPTGKWRHLSEAEINKLRRKKHDKSKRI